MEREATPRLLMEISIQLHLAGLWLFNTVSTLGICGVQRARSTVHNWVHKAELQPTAGHSPNHVAVDETVIRLNDERYWLYAAVDPETNELLYTQHEPTTNSVRAKQFRAELREKNDINDAVFPVDGSHSLKDACSRHGFHLRVERHGDPNSPERVFHELKRRPSSFSNCFSNAGAETAEEWLRRFAFAWSQRI